MDSKKWGEREDDSERKSQRTPGVRREIDQSTSQLTEFLIKLRNLVLHLSHFFYLNFILLTLIFFPLARIIRKKEKRHKLPISRVKERTSVEIL